MTNWWVVTDLDGTLLDHAYDWQPASVCLARLRDLGVPVIPCTSKTAAEVREFRIAAQLDTPFIVENGGAVYGGPPADEWRLVLGQPSAALHAELHALARILQLPLQALSDCSPQQVQQLTGLSGIAAQRAMQREWSMPFLPPAAEHWPNLQEQASLRGLQVVLGNRLAHLLSISSDKGLALAALKRHCAPPQLRVLGLGDSPNDIPLLEAADVAVVVPGPEGVHPQLQAGLATRGWEKAPAPHGKGWAAAVEAILNLDLKGLSSPGGT